MELVYYIIRHSNDKLDFCRTYEHKSSADERWNTYAETARKRGWTVTEENSPMTEEGDGVQKQRMTITDLVGDRSYVYERGASIVEDLETIPFTDGEKKRMENIPVGGIIKDGRLLKKIAKAGVCELLPYRESMAFHYIRQGHDFNVNDMKFEAKYYDGCFYQFYTRIK